MIVIRRAEWAGTGSLEARLTPEDASYWRDALRRMVKVDASTGCWIFQGSVDRNGYAKWRGPGWDIGGWAHRNAWFIHHGPIPWHLEVDHLCYVQTCVNVDHLELVTPEENKRRKQERRLRFRALAPVEHGPQGWAAGCRCDDCYAARPLALADMGSLIVLSTVDVSPYRAPGTDSLPAAPSWMQHAACASSDVDLWTKGQVGKHQLEAARRVCDACPVWQDCFDYALETQPTFGVWAGFRSDEFVRAASGRAEAKAS